MPSLPRALVLLAASAAAACTTTQDPGYSSIPRRTDSSGGGQWGDHFVVDASGIASWIQIDTDGGQPKPDQDTASGYGVRLASGDKDQSFGLLYQGLFAEGDAFDLSILGLDVKMRTPIDGAAHRLYAHAGGGFGWAWLDETFGGEVRNDAEAQLRIGLEYQATETFAITTSVGALGIGHVGDTAAWGTFLTLGATFVF
jgi:hypothetical protein